MARKKQELSLWEKLNEPVSEPTRETFSIFAGLAAAIVLFALAAPYFGQDNAVYRSAYKDDTQMEYSLGRTNYIAFFSVYEAKAYTGEHEPQVAGAQTTADEQEVDEYVLYNNLVKAFDSRDGIVTKSFVEVFDISSEIEPIVEFYEPAADAVWEAWLDLMKEPVL